MGKQKISDVLILLCIGFLLNACTKTSKELTVVEFIILNPANKEPFANVPVRIDERRSTNKGVMAETIFEGQTDANGKCKFEFHAKKGSGFWYVPYINENYFGDYANWEYLARPAINWDPITKDQYNEARYEIVFYAYLKEHIKNVNCEGSLDSLYYHGWYKEISNGTKSYNNVINKTGCYEYQTGNTSGNPPGYRTVFMGTHIYEYKVVRPSGVTYKKDSIYLEKGEFGEINALY